MIAPAALAAILRRRGVADWAILTRRQELATSDERRRLVRREECQRLTLVIHHDESRGRGSARLEVVATDTDAGAFVDRALALAASVVGPAWQSVPASAPAAVTLLDPALADADVEAIAADLLAHVTRPTGTRVELVTEVLRERVEARTRAGLATAWSASRLRVHGLIAGERRSLAIAIESRRRAALLRELEAELVMAGTDLQSLAIAVPATAGTVTLVLGESALLHGGSGGVWSAFAAQADAVLERQGLTRYRTGVRIAPGAERTTVPLTVRSDGALDFGTLSAPLDDEGDAVRRFTLVDRGTAVGLALSAREAALRGGEPNGGVRNLVVEIGDWDGVPPPGRTLEVRRLRNLAIDPYTGDASLDVELGIEHTAAGARPITGGTLRLDLITALARARRSQDRIERAGYVGPAAILIDDVELLA